MTSDLKTRCPHCQTAFRVSRSQLGAAAGMVRCGVCLKAFNAIDHLLGEAPPDIQVPPPDTADPGQGGDKVSFDWKDDGDFLIDDNFDISLLGTDSPPPGGPAAGATAVHTPQPDSPARVADTAPPATPPAGGPNPGAETKPEPEPEPRPEAEPEAHVEAGQPESPHGPQPTAIDAAAQPAARLASDPAPPAPLEGGEAADTELAELALDRGTMATWRPEAHSFIPDTEARGEPAGAASHWSWYLGSALAAGALMAQLAYFNSHRVERTSPLWPVTETLCQTLGCALKPQLDLDRIVSSSLVVRSHPRVAGALLVDAVIVNNAPFPQPFPHLTLVFEDLQSQVVARRTFTPREYLGGELDSAAPMPSGKPVKLELEIVDPGRDAVSFRLTIGQ